QGLDNGVFLVPGRLPSYPFPHNGEVSVPQTKCPSQGSPPAVEIILQPIMSPRAGPPGGVLARIRETSDKASPPGQKNQDGKSRWNSPPDPRFFPRSG